MPVSGIISSTVNFSVSGEPVISPTSFSTPGIRLEANEGLMLTEISAMQRTITPTTLNLLLTLLLTFSFFIIVTLIIHQK